MLLELALGLELESVAHLHIRCRLGMNMLFVALLFQLVKVQRPVELAGRKSLRQH